MQNQKDYILAKGSYITAPLTLLHHNPAYFWQPNEFQPRRFLKANENDTLAEHATHLNKEHTTHLPKTFHPFGIGPSTCPARTHAEAEIPAFVAAILSLWEFQPASPKEWIIPKQTDRETVNIPKTDPRVKVQARKLS